MWVPSARSFSLCWECGAYWLGSSCAGPSSALPSPPPRLKTSGRRPSVMIAFSCGLSVQNPVDPDFSVETLSFYMSTFQCFSGPRPKVVDPFRTSVTQVSKASNKQQQATTSSTNKHMVIPVPELGEFSAQIYFAYPPHLGLKLCMYAKWGCGISVLRVKDGFLLDFEAIS